MRSAVNSGVRYNNCNVGQCVDEMENVNMYQCNTGYKFEHNGQLYVRYSTKKGVKYLKMCCRKCPGRAKVKNGSYKYKWRTCSAPSCERGKLIG